MLDSLFGVAKAAAEAADIIETDAPTVLSEEEQEALDAQQKLDQLKEQDAANEGKAYPKSVGRIEAVVFDPQQLLDNLTELFGVYKGVQKVHKFSCPDCDWSEEVSAEDAGTIGINEESCCPGCGYEDSVSEFYDGTDSKITTSRTPTDNELLIMGVPDWKLSRSRDKMLRTFAELHGDKAFKQYENYITVQSSTACSQRCAESGCRCSGEATVNIGSLQEALVNTTGGDDDDE